MSQENYIERLRKVEKNIEGVLDFEQKALDRFGKPPIGDERRMVTYKSYTEPIVCTIIAYQVALGYIREHFSELREEE